MTGIYILNLLIGAVFTVCTVYQLFYIAVPFLFKEKPHKEEKKHRITVLIAARNEETVLPQLLESIRNQDYPSELITVCVAADNCTDRTAEAARNAGALVFERFDGEHVGKSYVLNFLLKELNARGLAQSTDAYLVLDADNLLEPDYITQMNRSFCDGYEVVTGYRNSKNFGDNWISAGYAVWFLRESQFINRPRHRLGSTCIVMGTGFLFSRKVAEEMDGWNYFSMTEDTDFSMDRIIQNKPIGYCEKAVLYDEQPTGLRQSVRQRIRWTKGSFQMFYKYGTRLLKGVLRGSWSCYDALAANLVAFIAATLGTAVNFVNSLLRLACGDSLMPVVNSVVISVGISYLGLFFMGAVTVLCEWKKIHASPVKKILYLFTYPIYIFTNLPIAVASLFCKVSWKPIHHTRAVSLEEMQKK